MVGYEALVRVQAAESWGSQSILTKRGIYLFADSIRPDFGAQPRERDNKIIGGRESSGSTYSVDSFQPTCEITWQPRVDDILPFMLAHFQIGTSLAGGTYQFWRVDRNLQFVSNGSNWGTHPYSINVDVYYGNSINVGGTGANGYRFFNGIVDKLTFSGKYGEDFKCTAMLKFLTGSRFTFPAGIGTAPSGMGSYSDFVTLTDWMGTTNITSEGNLQIDNLELSFDNKLAERSKLGQRGYNRFPLAAHWMAEGNIGMEFDRDLNEIAEGTAQVGTFQIRTGTTEIAFQYHNFVFRPSNPELSDGQSLVDITVPFRAYPSKSGGTSCSVYVYTGSTYGSLLFNFSGLL